VTRVPIGRRSYWAESGAIATLARQKAPAVLHTHIHRADLVGWLAGFRADVPLVATVHGHPGGHWRSALNEWLDRQLLRRFDAVVCVSESVVALMRRAGARPDRLHHVVNGPAPTVAAPRASARAELGQRGTGLLLGWVGRLLPEKGPDLFVETLAVLGRPDVRGVLVGDGPERAAVDARIRRGGLEDRVQCVGARPQAGRLLQAFDALVVSSRTEGSPMVVLEAMAAGVPVVAFGVGGIPHLLEGDAGWVAAPGDVHALAEACRAVLDDPTARAARTARAAEAAERRFGMARWLEELDAIYRELVTRPPRGGTAA
jgi:glycosyltransferase involved in cell wall biosynthesis